MEDDFFIWLYEEIINNIYEAYIQGIPIEDIAKEWEIDRETVIHIILQKEDNVKKIKLKQ